MADKKNLIFPPGFLNYFYFFVFETICVFKPKVYNIVNTLRGERTGCRGMVSPALAVDPTPLPSTPPLPIQSGCDFQEVHTHAGEAHWGRQANGSSCLDALALLPYSRANPQSLFPIYSLPRFQIRWRLTVPSVVFTVLTCLTCRPATSTPRT